jgi:transcriptional regulator with XRE-family HTH domain
MADTSRNELRRRDRAYYRRRQQNNVFIALTQLFAEEAEKKNISKKELADLLGKDPSQITRWLSAPSNFELDTISDILLAMGAEMDHRIVRFSERAKSNYAHPLMAPYLKEQINTAIVWVSSPNPILPDLKQPLTATIASSGPSPAVEISVNAK